MEAFRHNAWATRQLLTFCRAQTPEQMAATPPGTYGTILGTFNHLIYADAGYLPKPKVDRPAWTSGGRPEVSDLGELGRRVDETAQLWERYLADPLVASDLLRLDHGGYECRSSVPIVQALHHGNAHREQICAILTALGFQPPDLQGWAYADATGLGREVDVKTGGQ